MKLTSLLHWKADSNLITEGDLANIYNALFGGKEMPSNKETKIVDFIFAEMENCLKASDGVNFENKIVLSIAIRLKTEFFMINKINDPAPVSGISSNQTDALFKMYKSKFGKEQGTIKLIERVILMTPENIHLNSFMYEPILDMSDEHLKKLCREICSIS